MDKEREMVTIAEASERSGIPARTLRHAAKMGWLKMVRSQRPYLTTMEAVREFEVWKHVPRPRSVKEK